jgi:murein DD-endopeptidase MepM/ murein hydrolase activator NlpD
MRSILLFSVYLLFPLLVFCQEINNCGHIINKSDNDAPFQVTEQNNNCQIKVKNLSLPGNGFRETFNGYLTINCYEKNVPSTLYLFDYSGNLLFSISYKQIINLVVSANKKYAAFYDSGNTVVFDIAKLKESSYPSSIIFSVDDNGNPAYVSTEGNTLHYLNSRYDFDAAVYKLIFHQNELIVFTADKMYLIDNKKAELLYSFDSRFFDAASISGKLYFVNRSQNTKGFVFTLYETGDLIDFKEIQQEAYFFNAEAFLNNTSVSNENTGDPDGYLHEPIRGPINYSGNNVLYPIGNSYGEIQDYGLGGLYLHPGVDFMGSANQSVYAVKSGVVKAIITTSGNLHWRIAISNTVTSGQSTGYLYAHLNQSSIPFIVGDVVSQGTVVGTLVQWPSYSFTHCHFARIQASGTTWDGNWWTTNNPLIDVTNIVDNSAPVFLNAIGSNKFALRRKADGVYIQPDSVYGNVEVITKIYDLVNCAWMIDVYKIRYSMYPQGNPGNVMFDNLAFKYDMPLDEYINNIYTLMCLNTIYSRDGTCFSIGDYEDRIYYQIITNSNGDDTITDGDRLCYFNTNLYPDGLYWFKVTAWDATNNQKSDSMLIWIKNQTNAIVESAGNESMVNIFPNPNNGKFYLEFPSKIDEAVYHVFDILGNKISESDITKSANKVYFDISAQPKGIYILNVKGKNYNKIFKIIHQ